MIPKLVALLALSASAHASIEFKPLGEPGGGGAYVSLAISPHDPNHIVSGGDMLGTATSFDGGSTWLATFGFLTAEMATPTFHPSDPDVVWIGSCSGPYKSTDRGIHWQSKRKGMPALSDGSYTSIIELVLFDPDQPSRLLAFGGSSRRWNEANTFGWVWESTDEGESWRHIATLSPDGVSTDATKGGNIVWAAYRPRSGAEVHALLDGGIWMVSRDDGKTWSKHEPQGLVGAVSFITFDPTNPQTVYASTDNHLPSGASQRTPGGVFKSIDGGATFAPITQGLRTVASPDAGNRMLASTFSNVVLARDNPSVLYVNDRAWNASIIYRSTDAGLSWHPVAGRKPIGEDFLFDDQRDSIFAPRTATPAGVSVILCIDPNDHRRVFTFNSEFILRSIDAGRTWTDTTAFNPDPSKPDEWRGTGWNGWVCNEVRFNPYAPSQLVVQMMDAGRAWISDNDGLSWRFAQTDTHPWLGGNALAFTRDGHIYGTTGQFGQVNGITRSRDGGRTWESLAGTPRGLPGMGWSGNQGWMGGIVAHPEQSNRVWAVVSGRVLYSSDHGETWKPITPEGKFHWLESDPSNPDRFYASASDGIWVTDNGLDFRHLGGPMPVNRSKLHVDASGRVYATQWRQGRTGVWRYTPATKQWQRLIDEHQAFDVATDPLDPTRIVMVTTMDPFHDLAGGNGVWISHDDGVSWSRHDTGLAVLRSNCVEFDPKNGQRFIVGLSGRGFVEASWARDFKPEGTRTYFMNEQDLAHINQSRGVPGIINGSMDEGTERPVAWEGKWLGEGDYTVSRDTSTSFASGASLRIDTVGRCIGTLNQDFSVRPGQSFLARGAIRSEGAIKVNLGIQFFDASWQSLGVQQIAYTQGDSDWTSGEATIRVPDGTANAHVGVYVEGTGKAWLDEVGISPVD
jgi:hypothetical protein